VVDKNDVDDLLVSLRQAKRELLDNSLQIEGLSSGNAETESRAPLGVGVGFRTESGRTIQSDPVIKVYYAGVPRFGDNTTGLVSIGNGALRGQLEFLGSVDAGKPNDAAGQTQHQRPVHPGCAIGPEADWYGSCGPVCWIEGDPYWLTCRHVAAAAGEDDTIRGSRVLQPSKPHGGDRYNDLIGVVDTVVPIYFNREANLVDAALVKPAHPDLLSADIMGIGTPTGEIEAFLGMRVVKHGAQTGLTRGIISDIEVTINVNYDGKVALFEKQIRIRRDEKDGAAPFSLSGDSGSGVLQRDTNEVVGLIFAASSDEAVDASFANPVHHVIEAVRSQRSNRLQPDVSPTE